MDDWLHRLRIACRNGGLLAICFLALSSSVMADVESVPGTMTYCNPYSMDSGLLHHPLGKEGCGFANVMEAGKAFAAQSTANYIAAIPTTKVYFAIESCVIGKLNACFYYMVLGDDPDVHTVSSRIFIPISFGCPEPIVNPAVKYSASMYDATTVTCTRPVQGKHAISLSGGTEVEPSKGSDKKFLPIIATVKLELADQNIQPITTPVIVHVSLKVDPKSGGHDHGDSTRPRGGIAGVETCDSDDECWSKTTDENGQVVFNFNPPDVSGTHTITATCDGCSNTAMKPVDVKVNGLEAIPSSSFYAFIGDTNKHLDNHYLTPEAASILWRIAVSYQTEQQFKLRHPVTRKYNVTPPVLHVNDASLEWGGLFDIYGKWSSPHVEHRRGSVVDVRANNLDTAIPEVNFKEFKSLAADFGADAHFESPRLELRHVHLRLLNREE